MDVKDRIRALEDATFTPPLGGSFATLSKLTGVTAAGYNDGRTVEVTDAVPRGEVERVSER